MDKFYNIQDRDDIIRDGHSKALLMRDPAILAREKARQKNKAEKNAMENRISNLENDLSEIKDLLRKLVNK